MPQCATLLATLVIAALLGGTGISVADLSLPLLVRVAGSATGERGAVDGAADAARFNYPTSVSLHASGGFALIADAQNNTIRRFDLASGQVTTLAGSAGQRGEANGVGSAARFAYPSGVALSADGSFALVADSDNHLIRRIDVMTGNVTTLAGSTGLPGAADGSGPAAHFAFPRGIAFTADGAALVADFSNSTIRRIDLTNGAVTTLLSSAGATDNTDAAGSAAQLDFPAGIAVGGSVTLIADTYNHTLRRVGVVTLQARAYLPLAVR